MSGQFGEKLEPGLEAFSPTSMSTFLAVPVLSATYTEFESKGFRVMARILLGIRMGEPCVFADL